MMLHIQPGRVLGVGAGALSKRATAPGVAEGISTLQNWFQNGWVKKNVTLQLAEVEAYLSAHEYFSGNDKIGEGDVSNIKTMLRHYQIMMSYVINSIAYTPHMGSYEIGPATRKWIDNLRARPAWKRAVERQKREDAIAKANATKGKL